MKRKLSILILLLLLAGMLTGCGLMVPRPEVKKAEFDFSVTYELNEETKILSGVFVCEYNGTSWSLDGGNSRAWKGYFEGREGEIGYEIPIGTTDDGGTILVAFDFYPAYFMGDPSATYLDPPQIYLTITYPMEGVDGLTIISDEEAIAETYGVKIISYEYDAPIENTFGLFK